MGRLVAALLFPLLAVLLQLLLVFCVRTVQQARNAQLQGRQINAERPPSLLMPGASAVDIAVLVAIVTFSAQQFAVSRVFLEAFSSTSANGESYLAQDTGEPVLFLACFCFNSSWSVQMSLVAAVDTIV